MKLKAFWFFAIILLAVIVINHKTALYYYWGALVATVSYLNTRKQYLEEPYKWFNTLFLIYLVFVVWERTRHYQFSPFVELMINNLQHVCFGVMICFIATRVLKLQPFNVQSFALRLLLGILIFNGIGLINEGFQNSLQHRSFFALIPDSRKDIRMNLIGSALFLGAALVLKNVIVKSAGSHQN
ncbi:MAG: hypothetical protein V4722_18605 [Bacteroidota bacterium]